MVRGWGRGLRKRVINNALIVVVGKEPRPVLLQKRIYSITIGPNPLNPLNEQHWKTVTPDKVRINFPGRPRIWRPRRGRLGHIARPSVLDALDPLSMMLDAWSSASAFTTSGQATTSEDCIDESFRASRIRKADVANRFEISGIRKRGGHKRKRYKRRCAKAEAAQAEGVKLRH